MSAENPTPTVEAAKPKRSNVGIIVSVTIALAAMMLALAGWIAYEMGMLGTVLLWFLLGMLPLTAIARLWGAWRRGLEYGLVRRPCAAGLGRYRLQFVVRWAFWLLAGYGIVASFPFVGFTPEEYGAVLIFFWFLVAVMMALQLAPARRVRLSTNLFYLAGALALAVELARLNGPPPSGAVVLDAPFAGEWYVFNGGRSALTNHHFPIEAQRHALDLVRLVEGRNVKGDPNQLASYAAFGQVLYAPAAGTVEAAVGDRPDLPIGQSDEVRLIGNHLILDIGAGRHVLLAHLQNGSLLVKKGDSVRAGQPVARCGNSGNTSEPHLHLQVQSGADFEAPDLRTFPMLFRDVTLVRSGHSRRVARADLRRDDHILVPVRAP
jgi:hypothetical protein